MRHLFLLLILSAAAPAAGDCGCTTFTVTGLEGLYPQAMGSYAATGGKRNGKKLYRSTKSGQKYDLQFYSGAHDEWMIRSVDRSHFYAPNAAGQVLDGGAFPDCPNDGRLFWSVLYDLNGAVSASWYQAYDVRYQPRRSIE